MPRLQIYDPRERALVSLADAAFAAVRGASRPFRRRTPPLSPQRILLLRLERIGDLVMAMPAIADVRAAAPSARIDLIVGSWNADLARTMRDVDSVQVLDAAWLARQGDGLALPALLGAARRWREAPYDVAINFEPDVRSNLMLAVSGSAWTAGYASGGGGALLDAALDYDARAHTSANARRLVAAVFGSAAPSQRDPRLDLDAAATAAAERTIGRASQPLVGIHVSGGRDIKQWPPERFAEVARRLQAERGATIVLTGSPADRTLVDGVRARLLPDATIDVAGERDLVSVAAILQRLDLFVTGDTGPMHLANAVGTPVVAVFGPSDPARYAPLGEFDRVVRVDLPCAPCNRIRLPPERCVGHTPDCLASVTSDMVFASAAAVLDASRARHVRATASGPEPRLP